MLLHARAVFSALGLAAALLIGVGSASAAPKYQDRSHPSFTAKRSAAAAKPRKSKVVRGLTASRRPVHRPRMAGGYQPGDYEPRGYQPLYTDGHSVGFEPPYGPPPGYRSRWRRGNALVETMAIDQGTRFNGYNYGLPFE